MRIIKFKSSVTSEFENYIDIDSCERDYYCINFYLQTYHLLWGFFFWRSKRKFCWGNL